MAGFTDAADGWMPLDPRHVALAVDAQEHDANSVLAFTRTLIALRRESDALREGAFNTLPAPENVLAFERTSTGERLLCVFNLGDTPANFALAAPAGRTRLQIGDARLDGAALHLAAHSALLVEI